MNVTGSRLRHIGWIVVLAICMALFLALKFRVDAVKSEVRLAEREIVGLENDKVLLETEFETRSNQQQLARWNTVDFGFRAPRAEQFVENERQLAGLSTPRGINAPEPIRVVRAPVETDAELFPAMVSPMTGQPVDVATDTETTSETQGEPAEQQPALALADRLATSQSIEPAVQVESE